MIIRDSKGNRNKVATGALHFILTILIITLLIVFNTCSNYKKDIKEVNNLYEASKDTLHKTRNKLGEEVAKIEVLSSENLRLFTDIQFKDKDIQRLQDIVKRAKKENIDLNTALLIANSTILNLKDSIRNIIAGWEPSPDSPTIQYPIYTRDFKIDSCYTEGNVKLGITTFDLKLKIDNDFEVTIGDEKVSLFKRKQFATITNKNKCTTTTTLKVYDKKEKKTNVGKTFGLGVLAGVILKILL